MLFYSKAIINNWLKLIKGSSKSVVFMEWDKIWAFNKKVIDPIAPRYTALESQNRVVVNVAGASLETVQVPVHPKNTDIGTKTVWLGPRILIDYVDAIELREGENATFINWGNIAIKKIHKDTSGKITSVDASLNLENKDFKKTLKLTWLCELDSSAYTPTFCVYFEHIISKPVLGKDEDFKSYIGHETRVCIFCGHSHMPDRQIHNNLSPDYWHWPQIILTIIKSANLF